MPDEMVKVIDFAGRDDGSAQITLELNRDAVGRIVASQKFFHDEQSLSAKICEMMEVAVCRFAKVRN